MSRAKQLAAPAPGGEAFLSTPGLADRYDVSTRTIERWEEDPKLNFPKPDLIVHSRKYRKIATMEAWERKRATASST
jgi:hypothetical protein